MPRLWLFLVFLFLPTLVCKADMPAINETPNTHLPQNLLKNNDSPVVPYSDSLEIRYGFSSLKFNAQGPQKVTLDHRSKEGKPFSLVKTAEAAGLPGHTTPKDFERICNFINEADQVDDLASVLSPRYFQALQDKVKAGASQHMILAMIQAMRPHDIEIMDFSFQDEQAAFAVRGRSAFGPVEGLVEMVKSDGSWKIDSERWSAGGRGTRDYIASSLNPLAAKKKYTSLNNDLLSDLSPESRVNRNFLSLTKVPYHKSRRAFTFVFLLNKDKTARDQAGALYEGAQAGLAKSHSRTHMHVLFVGSKKIVSQQTVEQQYPIDFSLANYEDGYSARQWNLILPNKKPREVVVSFLFNF